MQMVPDVVHLTGPFRMTRSIIKSLEQALGQTLDDRNFSGPLNNSGPLAPKLFEDVLLLPKTSFGNKEYEHYPWEWPILVEHHFAGSWKNEKGGE